ncbi:MAG TPA: hypothetical protein VII97_11200 [Anaerolineales bacterium]
MLDEGNTPNMTETPDAPPPEEKSNRTFRIVAGVVAGLVFLTLVCMAIYFLVIAPRTAAQRNAAQATIEAGNVQAVQQLTSTAQAVQQLTSIAQAALRTPTLPSTPLPLQTGTSVPRTPTVSSTPVIALNSPAATATINPATLAAMQTQLVALQLTSTNPATLAAMQTQLVLQMTSTDPATLAAMKTQLALQMTSTAAAAIGTHAAGGQGMPTTGFFDDVGLPSMIILALALVAVIFLARRMRKSQTK